MLLEFVVVAVMVVFIVVREGRAKRATRGFVQAGKFLGIFLGVEFVVYALYDAAFHPEGLYPLSVPTGFTMGLVAALVWYFKRGKEAQHAT
jgi:hypothetical protein